MLKMLLGATRVWMWLVFSSPADLKRMDCGVEGLFK